MKVFDLRGQAISGLSTADWCRQFGGTFEAEGRFALADEPFRWSSTSRADSPQEEEWDWAAASEGLPVEKGVRTSSIIYLLHL